MAAALAVMPERAPQARVLERRIQEQRRHALARAREMAAPAEPHLRPDPSPEPLDAYARDGRVQDRERAAGQRFGALYRSVHGRKRLVPSWYGSAPAEDDDDLPAGGGEEQAEILARDLRNANAVIPIGCIEAVIDCCARREPPRGVDGLLRLRVGLARLADLWKIEDRPEPREGRIRAAAFG